MQTSLTIAMFVTASILVSGCGGVDVEPNPSPGAEGHCPDAPLALSLGGPDGRVRSTGLSVAVDSACNTILAGTSEKPIDLGGGTIGGSDGWFGFVAKLDPSGKLLWSKALPQHAYFEGKDILGVDKEGAILLAGSLSGDVDFGGGKLGGDYTRAGYTFLLKLDAQGNHVWSKRLEGNIPDEVGYSGSFRRVVESISIGADGSFVVGARFLGTVDLGGVVVQSKPYVIEGQPDDYKPSVFLAKYDPSGNLVWGKQFGGDIYNAGVGVDVNASGEVVMAFTHGGELAAPTNVSGGYFAKLSPAGNEIWSRTLPNSWFSSGSSVAAADDGGFVIGGYGVLVLPNIGQYEPAFAARFDANGNPTFGAAMTYGMSNTVSAVLPDENAGIRAVGYFEGSLLVHGKALVESHGGFDGFDVHAEFDDASNRASALGGALDDMAVGLARTPDGDAVIIGVEGPAFHEFDEPEAALAGGARIFVRRGSP